MRRTLRRIVPALALIGMTIGGSTLPPPDAAGDAWPRRTDVDGRLSPRVHRPRPARVGAVRQVHGAGRKHGMHGAGQLHASHGGGRLHGTHGAGRGHTARRVQHGHGYGHHGSHGLYGYGRGLYGHHGPYGYGRGLYGHHGSHGHGHGFRRGDLYGHHGHRGSLYGGSPYSGHYGSPYGGSYHGPARDYGSVRIEGEPRRLRDRTEVYVDGTRAGVVDDFDGYSQRLHLTPGKYLIELRLEGHEPLRQLILVSPEHTYKIRYRMEPLREGVTAPVPGYEAQEAYDYGAGHVRSGGPTFGAVRFEVEPRRAAVYVDGAHAGVVDDFDGSRRLYLQPGEHDLEIRLTGYEPLSRRILVTPMGTVRISHEMVETTGS